MSDFRDAAHVGVDGSAPPATALVAGASRGVGEAVARRLAANGTRTALVARSGEALQTLAGELGGVALPCDLLDAEAVEATAHRVQEALDGPPEVVVNAAGVFSMAPAHETSVEDFDRNVAVNLRGAFLLVRALLPAMLRRGRGLLVNVGSVAGRRGLPGNAAYGASKYGLRGLHEVLPDEVRGTGVRVALVEPAATDTELWDPYDPDADPGLPDRAEMLDPGDVARVVHFAATTRPEVNLPVLQVERA